MEMDVSVEEISGLTRELRISLPAGTVGRELDKAFDKLKREVSLKGFRRGKVPRTVLEKNFGDRVREEVADRLVQETYFDALEKSGLDAVVHPEIREFDFPEDGTFVYAARVDVRPEFELGQYKGLKVELPRIEAADEEIDARIEELRRRHAPLRTVDDRPVGEGDLVVIDAQGYHNGKPMPQVQLSGYSLEVGGGQLGPEFENALVGIEPGADASFEIDFGPGHPNPVLAGKKVEFKVSVKEVKERVLPEVDDEFAAEVNEEFKSVADLRNYIAEKIKAEKEDASVGSFNDRVMQKILENHEFEVPERLVRYEVNSLIEELEDSLLNANTNLEAAGINRQELEERYRDLAEKRVRGDFILKKIAETEDIKVTDEDIDNGFARVAEKYNMEIDEVKKYFARRDDLLPFLNELLSEKVLDFLKKESEIVYVEPEETEPAEKTEQGEA